MHDVISTTVSMFNRSINVLVSSGETERFALVPAGGGELFWRHDTFGADDDSGRASQWLAHGGRLTVGQVLARVPQCRREVLRWTREEIEAGPHHFDLDLFEQHARQASLARLADELAAAEAAERAA